MRKPISENRFSRIRPLKDGSIYTYYSRIAEPWLTHSLQYLDSEDDLNTNQAKMLPQIITNTRLAAEAGEPEFKKIQWSDRQDVEALPELSTNSF